MKRLTKRGSVFKEHVYFTNECPIERQGSFCPEAGSCKYVTNRTCPYISVIDRLADYEETGLTPEEVIATKHALMGKVLAEITEFEGIPLSRLTELAQAEREGRVVVLPCKVGDTVFFLRDEYSGVKSIQSNDVFEIKLDSRGIVIYGTPKRCSMDIMCYPDDIGKTVFLTRAEAEAELKEMKETETT